MWMNSMVYGRYNELVNGDYNGDYSWFINQQTLVGGLEYEFYDYPFSWEFHHPN